MLKLSHKELDVWKICSTEQIEKLKELSNRVFAMISKMINNYSK